MAQKIIKIGKSTGITLPKNVLEELNMRAGDEVVIEADGKRGGFFVRTARKGIQVDKELLDWTDKFTEEYRSALENLAKQ